jgi:hypothetical protein
MSIQSQSRGLKHRRHAEVPFCTAARVATVIVLARRSAPGRARSIAGSRTVDDADHSDCRMRICVLWDQA